MSNGDDISKPDGNAKGNSGVTAKPVRKKGLFGRMFGGKEEAAPEASVPEAPASEPAGAASTDEAVTAVTAGAQADADAAALALNDEVKLVSKTDNPPEEEPKGWFSRLKSGLSKTSSKLSDGITGVFTKRKLDDDTVEELEDLLIQADLGVETAMRITDALTKTRYQKEISPDEVRAVLAEEVTKVLEPVTKPLDVATGHKPHVILFVGVNGTGKTTTIGKLAQRLSGEGKKVMLAAGDTFRAAAIDQLKVWGERTGTPVIARDVGADAAGLAYDAMIEARSNDIDVLLIDTAGRLQNKQGLMDELEKLHRVIGKSDPEAPHDVILVLDATTGQNALNQVEVFRQRAGVTGLVMTKLDGTARGGILVAIAAKYGLPVHAIGVGEGADDLQPFDAAEFASAITLH